MRHFRQYQVWNNAMDLAMAVYKNITTIPRVEQFGLRNQIGRSAISIVSNIAEGSSRNSPREFKRYIEISIGSAFELETQLIVACKQGYIDPTAGEQLLIQLTSVQKQLHTLRNTLAVKNQKCNGQKLK